MVKGKVRNVRSFRFVSMLGVIVNWKKIKKRM
jgi:hypothetical protein